MSKAADREIADVAVVIPTYNDKHFLIQALASVAKQTIKPRQVIVVDDGSRESPAEDLAAFPYVTLITIPNQGLATARNVGLAAADTDFIVFLDADDLLESKALEFGLECFDANPDAAVVYGAYQMIDGELRDYGHPIYRKMGRDAGTAIMYKNQIGAHAAVMYRRSALQACGGFDPAFRYCEDYELYIRIAQEFPIAHHPNLIARYRMHGQNMSNDLPRMLEWHLAALRKNEPGSDASEALMQAWRNGLKRASREYAFRAWMENSPHFRTRWRNRLYMARMNPVATFPAIAKAAVWIITPVAVRNMAYRILRGQEVVKPANE